MCMLPVASHKPRGALGCPNLRERPPSHVDHDVGRWRRDQITFSSAAALCVGDLAGGHLPAAEELSYQTHRQQSHAEAKPKPTKGDVPRVVEEVEEDRKKSEDARSEGNEST